MVKVFIGNGDIYDDEKHHNIVFVGKDRSGDSPVCPHPGNGRRKFRGDVAGSLKEYSFCYRGNSDQLYVF